MRSISSSKISTCLDDLQNSAESFVIRRRNTDLAVIIPIKEYEKLTQKNWTINSSFGPKGNSLRLVCPAVGGLVSAIDIFSNGEMIDPVMAIASMLLFVFWYNSEKRS